MEIAEAAAGLGEAPLLLLPSPIGDVRYTPGHGLQLGRSGITLGGYSTTSFVRDEGATPTLAWDDLSLFVMVDVIPRVRLFAELEVEHLVSAGDERPDIDYVTERLYGDFTLSDRLSIRAGKFLTPIGRWNVIHAQPLVWTTSRPLVTFVPFDTSTTGVMLSGFLFPARGTVRYAVYGQPIDPFEPSQQSPRAKRSVGSRLEYAWRPAAEVGVSYLAFSEHGRWRHLGGADLHWQRDALQVMAELTGSGHGSGPAAFGFYLQPVLEIWPNVFAVGRYEYFEDSDDAAVNLVDIGIAYRPVPSVILKAEYLIADHFDDRSPPGFKSSFAMLF